LRHIQPATIAPFERKGIRLFEDRFEVKLFGEGTIRGTGGLRITGPNCETNVDGLYAAGDTATRELIAGATSGGGAQNAAWALTSGILSGAGAAALACRRKQRSADAAHAAGFSALRPSGPVKSIDENAIVRQVQDQILPLEKALWRDKHMLAASRKVLDESWHTIVQHRHAEGLDAVSARETASMTAVARWCITSALAREESRGIHLRKDVPDLAPNLAKRLLVGGLGDPWTRYEAGNGKASVP